MTARCPRTIPPPRSSTRSYPKVSYQELLRGIEGQPTSLGVGPPERPPYPGRLPHPHPIARILAHTPPLVACDKAAVVAAGFMAVIPAHLMRSVAGMYDNESVAVPAIAGSPPLSVSLSLPLSLSLDICK